MHYRPALSVELKTPSSNPWKAGRVALLSGVSSDGSPLPPPRKASASAPLPVTPRLTTLDAVGTSRPAASTTSTRTWSG